MKKLLYCVVCVCTVLFVPMSGFAGAYQPSDDDISVITYFEDTLATMHETQKNLLKSELEVYLQQNSITPKAYYYIRVIFSLLSE